MFDPSDYDPEDWGIIGRNGVRNDEKPVVLVAEGEVSANPLPGENRMGKRNCTFTVNVTGDMNMNMTFYTVRFRDECMRLIAGDKVRVRYVRNDRHNNLVASPELLEEGGKLDRIMAAIERIDKSQNFLMEQQSSLAERLMELHDSIGKLAGKVDQLDRDLFEEDDSFALSNPMVDPNTETIGGP